VKRLRLCAPKHPVELTIDGDGIVAERGEPVAVTLVASGLWNISRSAKFHRPRGPACFRGACEGCLVRINGKPNQRSCLVPAIEGMVVETQNTWGNRSFDLLGTTDLVFPTGFDHHLFMAGVPLVQQAMETFARSVVGIGELPDTTLLDDEEATPHTKRVDTLIVGGGVSGIGVARRLAPHARTQLVDARARLGGYRELPHQRADLFALLPGFDPAISPQKSLANVEVRTGTWCLAVYREKEGFRALLVSEQNNNQSAVWVIAKTVVFATGTYDVTPLFVGNDVPGVIGERALITLLSHGVQPGKDPLYVVPEATNERLALARELGSELVVGKIERVSGRTGVRKIQVRQENKSVHYTSDALIFGATRTGVYELAEQAGAHAEFKDDGFFVKADVNGNAAPGVWALGSVTGKQEPSTSRDDKAQAVAASILHMLSSGELGRSAW
jgi:sarcosine oxidase, subunit alpha